MLIAFLTTFNASKKEPLASLLDRIHAAFIASGLGEPVIQFSLSDAPIPAFASSVDRVLKRYPQLQRFVSTASTLPGGPPVRQISNGPVSPAAAVTAPARGRGACRLRKGEEHGADAPRNRPAGSRAVPRDRARCQRSRPRVPITCPCPRIQTPGLRLPRRIGNIYTAPADPRQPHREINLDVGTWSHSVTAGFEVQGLGFTARLALPVSKRAGGGQYQIGGAERWQQIVDNLAALVAELDRSFVPAVEAASGPSPEWYTPEGYPASLILDARRLLVAIGTAGETACPTILDQSFAT